MYITRKIKAKHVDVETGYLDMLAREAGRCYSKTVSLIRKTHKCKGFWLSQGAVQKYQRLREYKLHSQTVQLVIDSYYSALKSYFKVVKINPDAKPPKRTPKHFKVRWIQNGISYRDGVVRLSNGKDREPILINAPAKPVFVEMYYQRGSYYFSLVYKAEPLPREITGNVVAVDMGEIHPIVSHDGQNTIIYNGRRMIEYKAELAGIKVVFEDESYTSQTCPNCGHRTKPTTRNYHCNPCGYKYHRDGVGAINIWKKVSGWLFARSSSAHPSSDHPVVGIMAFPTGVRFHWHLCKSATP